MVAGAATRAPLTKIDARRALLQRSELSNQDQESPVDSGLQEVGTQCFGKAFRNPSAWFVTWTR